MSHKAGFPFQGGRMGAISRKQREILRDIYLSHARSNELNDLPPLPPYRYWRKHCCGDHGIFCVIDPILTAGQEKAAARGQ